MTLLLFQIWFTSYIVGCKHPSLHGNPGSQVSLILWRGKGCLLLTGHSWGASGQTPVLCFSNWSEEFIPGKQPQSAPFCSSRSKVAPSNPQISQRLPQAAKENLKVSFHLTPGSAHGILHYCRESLVEIYFLPHPADWAASPFSSNPCFLPIILIEGLREEKGAGALHSVNVEGESNIICGGSWINTKPPWEHKQ